MLSRNLLTRIHLDSRSIIPWALGIALAIIAGISPPLITVGLIVGTIVLVILLKKPLWGAYALVLSVPIQDAVELPGSITFTQVLFVLVLGIWFAWISLRADRRLYITGIALGLFFFVLTTLPSLWNTTSLP